MRTSQQGSPTGVNAAGHGLGSALGGSAGRRLPVPPRERKPALAALAVLLILGGALVSAYLVVQSGKRVTAISVAKPVAAGEQIPLDALESVTVSNTGVEFLNWSERANVVKAYAAVPLVPGTLLNNNMITSEAQVAKGRLIVGLALKPNQYPAEGLSIGDTLALYSMGGSDKSPRPLLLSADAEVRQVVAPSATSRASSSGELLVSISVKPEEAQAIALASSAGAVTVAVVPPGTTVPTRPGGQNGQNGQTGQGDRTKTGGG
ncbi:hypothetical protein [Actinocorallia sp. A-T 12471]|uniref:hypothetical protein n=1 Tax=Actinocorallia sp. A-T 12471 TaxID=3089813 RepID=UPI0029CE66D7|nr:hypothetical protein [Actinocorallia sp. A-T 12471]MDX6744531.1 hypothetical protein [Actinocorallia sp. A-T 12471]